MFYTCGPNEAMVVSGCCHSKPAYIVGGRIWVWPCIQQIQRISLNTITLIVESPRVYTALGVPLTVTGVAQVKIQGQNADMLETACEQFLGKSEHEVQQVALETLEGHQRAIMGLMTVEEIYQDRKLFSQKVFEVASSDLINMGISVVSYTLKDIRDDQAYLSSLGAPRTAQVKRDARMGEATARKEGGVKQALAEEQQQQAKYVNDIEIAKAQRDYNIKKAAYDEEVAAKKASADLAYKLQAAKTKQKIREEEMEVMVIERAQQIALQEQEITRRERELDATVRRPAEAEKYSLEKLADARKQQIILQAEAEAQSIKLKGEAEAFAIEQKAKAEAEQMAKKAEAWREYKDAAMVDMLLEALPKIAAEVASPLASNIEKMTMVSTGKGDIGVAKLTNEVMDIVVRVPGLVESLTGIELTKALKMKGH